MRMLVESLKRLYENGKIGKKPSITLEQAKQRVVKGTITEEEYEYIVGEPYEPEKKATK